MANLFQLERYFELTSLTPKGMGCRTAGRKVGIASLVEVLHRKWMDGPRMIGIILDDKPVYQHLT